MHAFLYPKIYQNHEHHSETDEKQLSFYIFILNMWISLELAKCVMCFFLAVLFHSPYDRWATKRAQFYVCHKITVNRLEMELTIPDILNNVQNTQYRTIDKMMRLRRVALRVWNVTRKKRNNKNKNKNKEEKNYRNTISFVCMCFIYKIDPTITSENGKMPHALVLSDIHAVSIILRSNNWTTFCFEMGKKKIHLFISFVFIIMKICNGYKNSAELVFASNRISCWERLKHALHAIPIKRSL